MRRIGTQVALTGLLILLWAACDSNRVFEEYKAIPKEGWHKDSLINFSMSITDTLQNHNLYLNVRNDIKYNYSNLWLFITINQPGNLSLTDTFEITLADPSGKWIGKGLSGTKSQQAIYKGNVFFPVTGEYNIGIQHGMRESLLTGIKDLGFRVEEMN